MLDIEKQMQEFEQHKFTTQINNTKNLEKKYS